MSVAIHDVDEKGCLTLMAAPPRKWSLPLVISNHEHTATMLLALVQLAADGKAPTVHELAIVEGARACVTSMYAALRARELELQDALEAEKAKQP